MIRDIKKVSVSEEQIEEMMEDYDSDAKKETKEFLE